MRRDWHFGRLWVTRYEMFSHDWTVGVCFTSTPWRTRAQRRNGRVVKYRTWDIYTGRHLFVFRIQHDWK